jgi:hypothetical protein
MLFVARAVAGRDLQGQRFGRGQRRVLLSSHVDSSLRSTTLASMGVTELTRIIRCRKSSCYIDYLRQQCATVTAFGDTACDMDSNTLKELRRCLRLEWPHNK